MATKYKVRERNYIIIYEGRLPHYRCVRSVSKWFDDCDYFSFHIVGDELEIRKHYQDAPKYALKKTKAMVFTMTDLELPIGTFNINQEDSNENVLVVSIN